jgi:hypothetical protein
MVVFFVKEVRFSFFVENIIFSILNELIFVDDYNGIDENL